eukprot:m.186421 g.186421  ORF g.186421 m.186421 type:complete len:459 (+) comp14754_c0_seq15:159-1535(+)
MSALLFVHPNGNPMTFFMLPSAQRRSIAPLLQLMTRNMHLLLQKHGGKFTKSSRQADFVLTTPQELATHNSLHFKFVHDCILAGKVVNVGKYLMKATASPTGRSQYTDAEDMQMILFAQRRPQHSVNGTQLYDQMVQQNICPGRTAQSLRERMRKRIIPRIEAGELRVAVDPALLQPQTTAMTPQSDVGADKLLPGKAKGKAKKERQCDDTLQSPTRPICSTPTKGSKGLPQRKSTPTDTCQSKTLRTNPPPTSKAKPRQLPLTFSNVPSPSQASISRFDAQSGPHSTTPEAASSQGPHPPLSRQSKASPAKRSTQTASAPSSIKKVKRGVQKPFLTAPDTIQPKSSDKYGAVRRIIDDDSSDDDEEEDSGQEGGDTADKQEGPGAGHNAHTHSDRESDQQNPSVGDVAACLRDVGVLSQKSGVSPLKCAHMLQQCNQDVELALKCLLEGTGHLLPVV